MKLKELFEDYIDAQKYNRLLFWFGLRNFDILTSQFNYRLFCKQYGAYKVIGVHDRGDCLSIDLKKPFWNF